MPTVETPIRYRSNGKLWGLRVRGMKVRDAVTGFWTYTDYQTTNDYGDLVDSRGDGLDTDQGFPYVVGTPSS